MYSYNPYYGKYLAHYGVLGMKWGVRKANQYARDINQHRRNKAVKEARLQKNRGEITKEQYKVLKKNIKAQQKIANARDYQQIKNEALAGKGDPSKKAGDIYSKYKRQAYSEIPNYFAKRGIRIAAKAGAHLALSMALANLVSIPVANNSYAKEAAKIGYDITSWKTPTRVLKPTVSMAIAKKTTKKGVELSVGRYLDLSVTAVGNNAATKATLKAMGLATAASAPVATGLEVGAHQVTKRTM